MYEEDSFVTLETPKDGLKLREAPNILDDTLEFWILILTPCRWWRHTNEMQFKKDPCQVWQVESQADQLGEYGP
jgi:hypothetical protein